METFKSYRFNQNYKEEVFHDKFKEHFNRDHRSRIILDAVIFGWQDSNQKYPKDSLSNREENICVSLIQWLGSLVGQSFLEECGFVSKDKL